ncbi:MAG: hypothetical protein IKX28_05585 [Bacteroidales bacterium]|nr:hypothetical protein [Bacteroidales bacterium]
MKPLKIILLFAGLILLVGCEKASPDSLQGRWVPIYGSGMYEFGDYIYSFDGPVDEHGQIPAAMVGKINPDIKYDPTTILITGIRFFRKNGEDVFISFYKDSPHNEIGKPLLYRVENGKLYCELPMGAFINCSPDVLEEGSGEFDEGSPISFLGNGQIKIGDFTYSKSGK